MSIMLDDYTLQDLAKQRAKDYQRDAEIDRMLREPHARSSGRWSRQARRLCLYLAHALTRLGQRLETLEMSNAESMQEQDAIGAAVLTR